MTKFLCRITSTIAAFFWLASMGLAQGSAAQKHAACGTLATLEAQENCEALYGYLKTYIVEDAATDYFFLIEDLVAHSYPELRAADAVHIMQMYEADGHLIEGRIDRNSRHIVTRVIGWLSLEQTAGGASVMEATIKRLHRIAPDTTKRAIAYAALTGLDNLGGNFSPWDTAVGLLDDYGVSIRGMKSRDIDLK